MPKLNQIVALVTGKKTRVEKEFGDLNKIVQKQDLFHGLTRTYATAEEGGEVLPSERKDPQKSVTDIVDSVKEILAGIIDAVATQEVGNTVAKADVIVDGQVIVPAAPVTVLLYLEKQLNDLHTFVSNLPTLDPAERWTKNEQNGQYETEVTKTVRTRKIQKPIVLYPATDKHPAQTQLVAEDITAGYWSITKFATVMSPNEKKAIVSRIVKLTDAVKVAREEANSADVKDVKIAGSILGYVFGK